MDFLCHWTSSNVMNSPDRNTVIQTKSVIIDINRHQSFLSSTIELFMETYIEEGCIERLTSSQVAVTQAAMKLLRNQDVTARPSLRTTRRGRGRASETPTQIVSAYLSSLFTPCTNGDRSPASIPILRWKAIPVTEDLLEEEEQEKRLTNLADECDGWEIFLDRREFMACATSGNRGGRLLVRLDFLVVPDIFLPSANDKCTISFNRLPVCKFVTYKFDDDDDDDDEETHQLRSARPFVVSDQSPRHMWNMSYVNPTLIESVGLIFNKRNATEFTHICWKISDLSQVVVESGNDDLRASLGCDFDDVYVETVWFCGEGKARSKKRAFRDGDCIGISFENIDDECDVCLWKNKRKFCGVRLVPDVLPDSFCVGDCGVNWTEARVALEMKCGGRYFDVKVASL